MIVHEECPTETNRCSTRVMYAVGRTESTASSIYIDDAERITLLDIWPADVTLFQPLLDAASVLPTATPFPTLPGNLNAIELDPRLEYRPVGVPGEVRGALVPGWVVIFEDGDFRSRLWLNQVGEIVETDIQPQDAELFAPFFQASGTGE
jgi:hypothetical protein